jgi:hypothetical protein
MGMKVKQTLSKKPRRLTFIDIAASLWSWPVSTCLTLPNRLGYIEWVRQQPDGNQEVTAMKTSPMTDSEVCGRVAERLRATGHPNAHYDHTGGGIFCVFVPTTPDDGREWIFGAPDATWGGELQDDEGQPLDPHVWVETKMSSESEDIHAIAAAIAAAMHASDAIGERADRHADVLMHGRQTNRDDSGICHKVTVCLRSMGYTNAHYGDTGGGIFCVFVPTDVKAARYEGREWIFGLTDNTWGGELLDEEGQPFTPNAWVDTGISVESEDVTAIATAIATAMHTADAIDFKVLASAFMPELMRHSDTFTEWTLEFPGIVELHVEGGGVWIIGDTNGPIGADYYFSKEDFGEGEPSHYSVEIAASDDPAIIAERLSAAMSAV